MFREKRPPSYNKLQQKWWSRGVTSRGMKWNPRLRNKRPTREPQRKVGLDFSLSLSLFFFCLWEWIDSKCGGKKKRKCVLKVRKQVTRLTSLHISDQMSWVHKVIKWRHACAVDVFIFWNSQQLRKSSLVRTPQLCLTLILSSENVQAARPGVFLKKKKKKKSWLQLSTPSPDRAQKCSSSSHLLGLRGSCYC